MKKIFTLMLFLISYSAFCQGVQASTSFYEQLKDYYEKGYAPSIEALKDTAWSGRTFSESYGGGNSALGVAVVFMTNEDDGPLGSDTVKVGFIDINKDSEHYDYLTYSDVKQLRFSVDNPTFSISNNTLKTEGSKVTIREYNGWLIEKYVSRSSNSYFMRVINKFISLPGDNSKIPSADEIFYNLFRSKKVKKYTKGDYSIEALHPDSPYGASIYLALDGYKKINLSVKPSDFRIASMSYYFKKL